MFVGLKYDLAKVRGLYITSCLIDKSTSILALRRSGLISSEFTKLRRIKGEKTVSESIAMAMRK